MTTGRTAPDRRRDRARLERLGRAPPPASGPGGNRGRVERVQPLKDLDGARPGRPVRPAIHVPPRRRSPTRSTSSARSCEGVTRSVTLLRTETGQPLGVREAPAAALGEERGPQQINPTLRIRPPAEFSHGSTFFRRSSTSAS